MISPSNDLAKKCKIDFEDCEDHRDRCIKILYFQLMTELIDRLGWHEHTSDWDPWIQIQFNVGMGIETIENMIGYIDFDWVDKNGNELTIEDGVKPGKLTICCDHKKIWGIQLWIDFDDKEEMPIKSCVVPIDSLISMIHCY